MITTIEYPLKSKLYYIFYITDHYTGCPLCGMYYNHNEKYDTTLIFDVGFIRVNLHTNNNIQDITYYCLNCNMLFQISCLNFISATCFNSRIIGSFCYNGEIIKGCPKFKSIEDMEYLINSGELTNLIFICSCSDVTNNPEDFKCGVKYCKINQVTYDKNTCVRISGQFTKAAIKI